MASIHTHMLTHVQTHAHKNTHHLQHRQFSPSESQFSPEGGHRSRAVSPTLAPVSEVPFSSRSLAQAGLVFWCKEEETQTVHTFRGLYSPWFP